MASSLVSADKPTCGWGASCIRHAATKLVDVDGEDDRRADDDLLPEGLDGLDDEAVLENGGDERADAAAEHRADAPEQAGAAEHGRADRVQVVGLVRDRRLVPEDRE